MQTILRAAGSKKNALTDVYDNASRTPVTALFWNSELNDSSSVRILTDLADAIGDFAGINLSTPVPLPENWSSGIRALLHSFTLIETHNNLVKILIALLFTAFLFIFLFW